MRGKPLILKETKNGCIVSTSHKLNTDGYLRVRDYRYSGSGRKPLIMIHRLIWEEANGEIPEGYEIHHTCHNRACCNINHLELVNISEHRVEHNSTRYSKRKESAREYWDTNRCTGAELSRVFDVSDSAACGWIREWKCRD